MARKKQEAVNGSFGHLITGVVRLIKNGSKRPCPVCCKEFGRDCDLELVENRGKKFLLCNSNHPAAGEKECGFAVSVNFSTGQIRQLAKQRIAYLREQRS